MKESNNKLRRIENDYMRLKNEISPVGVMLVCLILGVVLSLFIWHEIIPNLLLKETSILAITVKIVFFISLNLIFYIEPAQNFMKRKKIKEKYGNYRRKRKIEREKIILNIRNSFTINEIQSYYKKSSDSFKNEILDVVIIREINKELGVENELTSFELLKKLKNNKTIEVNIMND